MKAVFLAPPLGAIALIASLPYLIVAMLLYATFPWFELSPEANELASSILDSLPKRRRSSSGTADPTILIGMFVIGFAAILFLFRIQSVALRLIGFRSNRPVAGLIFPARAWWPMPGGVLIAYITFAYFVVSSAYTPHNPSLHVLLEPISSSDPLDYYNGYARFIRHILVLALILFVPFGLSCIRNAGPVQVPFRTFLRSAPLVLILGILHAVVSAGIALGLVHLALAVIPEENAATANQAWVVLALNSILYFSIMSYACAALLANTVARIPRQ